MERLKAIIQALSARYEYFSEMNINDKTHCWNFAKEHRRLGVYTLLLNEECTLSYFLLKVLDKTPEKAKPGAKPHFTHLSHVQYQLDKKKRWEVVKLIKVMEVYRKNLKETLYSGKVQSIVLNDLGECEVVERQIGLFEKDRIEEEYVAISNYIKTTIDLIA